jgi:hypothetical protein
MRVLEEKTYSLGLFGASRSAVKLLESFELMVLRSSRGEEELVVDGTGW